MQYLLLAIIFMVWLALVISFARSRCGAKSILLSKSARINIFHRFHSNDNNGNSFNAKQLNSISTTSDSGHDSTVNRKSRRTNDPREKPQRIIFKQPNNGTASPNPSQRSVPRQNLSGRRVLDSERTVLNKERDRLKQAEFAPPKDIFEEFSSEFRKVIRSREFETAIALYRRMKEANFYPRETVLTGLLSICQKKEHLTDALAIFADFAAGGIPPNESAYMSLIRCYSDNGQITEALELIEKMSQANLELKLRSYHPVLEAVCKNNDFEAAMIMIKQMHKSNVVPRSEQLTLLLQVSATSGAIDNAVNRKQIDELLLAASLDLLGMETEEMRRVVGAFCDLSAEEVLEEGILIETRDDLPGEILDINDSGSSPVVTAMNSTYTNVSTLLTDMVSSPTVIDNTIPIGYDLYSFQG
jgi:pentatricopeptide repeat protein